LRIFVLDTYYPAFLRAHYAGRPELAAQPYDVQLGSLMEQSFGTSDAYSHYLGALGHEAVEIVANSEPLQLAWAREGGVRAGVAPTLSAAAPGRAARRLLTRRLLRRIARAQIDEFDPDVVYVHDLWFFGARDVEAMTRSGRLVVGQIASSPPPERLIRSFGLLLTSFPHFVERFRRIGVDAEYLRLAFDERVLERLERRRSDASGGEMHDVTFIGGLDPTVHPDRVRLLAQVADEFDLAVWGYGVDGVAHDSPLRRSYRGQAWALEMYGRLSRSRITLNRHIDVAAGYANNMRLFEATGIGTFLLTDAQRNVADMFDPEREVVTYSSVSDLIRKARFYLEREDERREIAAAGQRRTLAEHTYRHRMPELVNALEARLERR
jgi:spore maturation protein CgeB